ncbi:MAG: cytochrome c [Gemmatimonadota bacterium]|nr:cytochrome c [Gemmatimonadota bacterium]
MADPARGRGRARRAALLALALLGVGTVAWWATTRTVEPPRPVVGSDPGPPPPEPAELYHEHCLPCHRLGGEGGIYGPDLDRVGEKLSPSFVAAYIRAPSALERDARMPPSIGLSREQIESLAAYVVEEARKPPSSLRRGP